MAATVADIALYTTDGVVLTAPADPAVSAAIKADNIDAKDSGDREIEMFFDNTADGQVLLNERFTYLSKVNPLHLGIEVSEALGMGDTIPLTPAVPTFRIVDDSLRVNVLARTRAYAHDMATDRFSVEVMA
jgi:hypothetical protein